MFSISDDLALSDEAPAVFVPPARKPRLGVLAELDHHSTRVATSN